MHMPICVSFDRPCRLGGAGACRRCPHRRTEAQREESLLRAWKSELRYGRAHPCQVPARIREALGVPYCDHHPAQAHQDSPLDEKDGPPKDDA